jgi:hypothetical protein
VVSPMSRRASGVCHLTPELHRVPVCRPVLLWLLVLHPRFAPRLFTFCSTRTATALSSPLTERISRPAQ